MAKILLVEDDKSLREIYGVRLMAEGYTIISAGDGEEALAVAIKERPDLIVSDVMMPKISGFDMLDILRSTTETKDIKVIMMTALSSEDQRARGEALGADRYLVKSQVGIEDVVRTVHDVLGDSIIAAAPAMVTPTPVAVAPVPIAPPVAVAPPVYAPMPQPILAPLPVVAPVAYTLPVAPIAPPVFTPAPIAPPTPITLPTPITPTAPVAPVAPVSYAPPVYTPAPVAPAPLPPAPIAAPVVFPPSVTLPEPLAPFSSNPPASLGDRIINPLPSATDLNGNSVADIATQMNQELNAHLQGLDQPAAPIAPIQYATPAQPLAPPPAPPIPPLPPQPGM